jgi:hypothetical protein
MLRDQGCCSSSSQTLLFFSGIIVNCIRFTGAHGHTMGSRVLLLRSSRSQNISITVTLSSQSYLSDPELFPSLNACVESAQALVEGARATSNCCFEQRSPGFVQSTSILS